MEELKKKVEEYLAKGYDELFIEDDVVAPYMNVLKQMVAPAALEPVVEATKQLLETTIKTGYLHGVKSVVEATEKEVENGGL